MSSNYFLRNFYATLTGSLHFFLTPKISSIGLKVIKVVHWASLVVQWLRVCLLMQGTRVRALVWEDPTCRGATGPVSHNY